MTLSVLGGAILALVVLMVGRDVWRFIKWNREQREHDRWKRM